MQGGPDDLTPREERSRWRRDQHRRRRLHLSRRGAATLACFLALAVLLVLVVGALPLPAPQPSEGLPSVASAPGVLPDVPIELMERVPVAPSTLELPVMAPDGSEAGRVGDAGVGGRLFEWVEVAGSPAPVSLRVEYSLDAELTRQVFRVLSQGRVALGHVIVLEPRSGRVLAYASTAPEEFPPTRAYPAASLVKVITAAAALDARPETAQLPCRFSGNPWKLTRKRIDPPARGDEVSLRKALATSNNQCFAQLAVHALGGESLMDAIARFGWLSEPAPAHAAGSADPGEDRYDVGRLGCGLAGCRITPLHAGQLATTLAHGELVTPRWVDRVVDAEGRELPLPALPAPRRVMSWELAAQLREMLVDTTTRGTARSSFRKRNGRPLLGPVRVAGKTGRLTGQDPDGRYEWFIGVAPAEDPRIAVATLVVNGDLWWRSATQIAAEVLRRTFCGDSGCSAENAGRFLGNGPAPEPEARAGGAAEADPLS